MRGAHLKQQVSYPSSPSLLEGFQWPVPQSSTFHLGPQRKKKWPFLALLNLMALLTSLRPKFANILLASFVAKIHFLAWNTLMARWFSYSIIPDKVELYRNASLWIMGPCLLPTTRRIAKALPMLGLVLSWGDLFAFPFFCCKIEDPTLTSAGQSLHIFPQLKLCSSLAQHNLRKRQSDLPSSFNGVLRLPHHHLQHSYHLPPSFLITHCKLG